MNVRTTPFIIEEIDGIVKKGYFRNRTEAVNEALRFLIRRYKMAKTEKRIEKIREGTSALPSVTQAVVTSHGEEDEL